MQYIECNLYYIGTSPVVWNDLKKGKHTVIIKARCLVGGNTVSSKRLKLEFQVR